MAKQEEPKKRLSARQVASELRLEAIKTFSILMTSAFALVAALAWNEFIKDAINRYIEPGSGLRSRLIYALAVTFLAVIVSYELGKIAGKYKVENEQTKENED